MRRCFVSLPKTIVIMLVLTFSICLAQGSGDTDQQNGGSANEKKQAVFPKIQFDEISFDLGTVYQRRTLKHTFTFKNIGTGVLHIKKVKAG